MRRRPAALLSLLLASCASTAPVPTSQPHQHRHTTTVTIAADGLRPGAEVRIPAFSTVVWRNQAEADATVEVLAAACPECETVLGFAPSPRGARSAAIAPGGLTTLCFHDPGSFAFVVAVGGVERRGTLVVGSAQ